MSLPTSEHTFTLYQVYTDGSSTPIGSDYDNLACCEAAALAAISMPFHPDVAGYMIVEDIRHYHAIGEAGTNRVPTGRPNQDEVF